MVKKQSNKYQNLIRDCWDETTSNVTSTTTTTTTNVTSPPAPESPTEACVAPPYYTPLTNRTSKYLIQILLFYISQMITITDEEFKIKQDIACIYSSIMLKCTSFKG